MEQGMESEPFINLFQIKFTPDVDFIFRGPRNQNDRRRTWDKTLIGNHVYSTTESDICTEKVEAQASVLKILVRKTIAKKITKEPKFFDIRPFGLCASIAGNLLYREDAFSVAQGFELQLVSKNKDLYLAVLAHQRIYNRLQLSEVIKLVGKEWIMEPHHAICFAGEPNKEKWQDCEILDVLSTGQAIIEARGIKPSQITITQERIIPKLNLNLIKKLLSIKRSRTQIEQLMMNLRRKNGRSEAENLINMSKNIREKYINVMFPMKFGDSRMNLSNEPALLSFMGGEVISNRFLCVPRPGGGPKFDSIHDLLKNNRFSNPEEKQVAILCTPRTKSKMLELIKELNEPTKSIGGFAGMPKNFNIKIVTLPDTPYVAKNPEEYIELGNNTAISPDAVKRSALALVALSKEDENYNKPIPLYFRLKSLFAQYGRPSQVIDPKTVDNKYAYWNIALNLAAKFGKVPWTLEDPESLKPVQLFLGFSYSLIRSKEIGTRRNIAYVNVFGGDGTWKLFYSDDDVFSFEDRIRRFPKLAANAVQSATDDLSELNVVEVHYSKRFGKLERKAIAKGIRSVAPKADIIFVSINQDHPIRFFDPRSDNMCCPRGTILNLDDETAYIQTLDDDSWPMGGLPRPLRIHVFRDYCTIHEDSRTVSKRILGLTRLNWRSIREYSSLPVTILYSSLVARLTNYFSLSESKLIENELKRTPWFL